MIIKGIANMKRHLSDEHIRNRVEYYKHNPNRRATRRYVFGVADGIDYFDDDYVFDALFDVPNR